MVLLFETDEMLLLKW